jgi:hypothetical protein
MRRLLVPLAVISTLMLGLIPAAGAQEITGGCTATVNGQSVTSLTRLNPLVVTKGTTVALVGSVPASAGSGQASSETKIFVEVVGDLLVATEIGTGPTWGGSVVVPKIITQLAPGIYKVKGTATGSTWLCTGSAYVKVDGGPLTAASAVGAVLVVSGLAAAAGARRSKHGLTFRDANDASVRGGDDAPAADRNAGLVADAATLGVFALLVALVGYLGPSWVL